MEEFRLIDKRHKGLEEHKESEVVKVRLPAFEALPRSKADEFSVVSWNILLHKLLKEQPQRYPNLEHREWAYRRDRILTVVRKFDADIVCLQEINKDSFQTDFGNALEACGYKHSVGLKKHASVRSRETEMSRAMAWKKSRFKLILFEDRTRVSVALFKCLDISKAKRRHSKEWLTRSQELLHSAISEEQKERNGRFGIKKSADKKSGDSTLLDDGSEHYVFVVNCHLAADNGGDSNENESERVNQLQSAFKRMQYHLWTTALTLAKQNTSVVVVGDLNSDLQSALYKQIVSEKQGVGKGKSELRHGLRLADAYNASRRSTLVTGGKRSTVDFVFHSKDTLKVLGALESIPETEQSSIELDKMLPNDRFVSDHLPVGALFRVESLLPHSEIEAMELFRFHGAEHQWFEMTSL